MAEIFEYGKKIVLDLKNPQISFPKLNGPLDKA